MGGWGSASGISDKGIIYGTEFESILSVDNIKFVRHKLTSAATVPLETMSASEDRVYVVVNAAGNLKSITFYDQDGKLNRQIDLAHEHQGHKPHVHPGYDHRATILPLSQTDRNYIEKVLSAWARR